LQAAAAPASPSSPTLNPGPTPIPTPTRMSFLNTMTLMAGTSLSGSCRSVQCRCDAWSGRLQARRRASPRALATVSDQGPAASLTCRPGRPQSPALLPRMGCWHCAHSPSGSEGHAAGEDYRELRHARPHAHAIHAMYLPARPRAAGRGSTMLSTTPCAWPPGRSAHARGSHTPPRRRQWQRATRARAAQPQAQGAAERRGRGGG
jgi:hypothetical protein